METFQTLNISIPHEKMGEFKLEFFKNLYGSTWIEQEEIIKRYKKNKDVEADINCIKSDILYVNDKEIQGLVWYRIKHSVLEVFNIVPTKPGSLSFKEYNYILNKFYEDLIAEINYRIDLDVDFSSPNQTIEDILGSEISEALKLFSDTANKTTGHSHPQDFDLWCNFVFKMHRKNKGIDPNDFLQWLTEEGWDEKTAYKLVLDLEYSISLLSKYD